MLDSGSLPWVGCSSEVSWVQILETNHYLWYFIREASECFWFIISNTLIFFLFLEIWKNSIHEENFKSWISKLFFFGKWEFVQVKLIIKINIFYINTYNLFHKRILSFHLIQWCFIIILCINIIYQHCSMMTYNIGYFVGDLNS